MTLIGMSAETWQKILDETNDIYYLIALHKKHVSKSVSADRPVIKNILVNRHNLDFNDTQTFIIWSGRSKDVFHFPESNDSPVWIASRSEPKIENYPEVAEFLKEK